MQKILLVDDDADDQLFFLDALRAVNDAIVCDVANNGIEALEHLETTPPLPSLIFLDLNMPMMNGYECLEHIKKQRDFKDIPVVIFTTSSNPKDRDLTKKLGAKVFLTKTSDLHQMRLQLSEILKLELN